MEYPGRDNSNRTESESYLYLNYLMTKEINRDGYTDRQYEKAKRAWNLYINTGGGGLENFKHYLRQNIIKNNPITNNDVNQAEKIFQREVGHLKGSMTRKTPRILKEDCLLYTSPSPRDGLLSRMPSSA